jgi:hypothetical protein
LKLKALIRRVSVRIAVRLGETFFETHDHEGSLDPLGEREAFAGV